MAASSFSRWTFTSFSRMKKKIPEKLHKENKTDVGMYYWNVPVMPLDHAFGQSAREGVNINCGPILLKC